MPHNLLGNGHAFSFKKMMPISVLVIVLLEQSAYRHPQPFVHVYSRSLVAVAVAALSDWKNREKLLKAETLSQGINHKSFLLVFQSFQTEALSFFYQLCRFLEACKLYLGFMPALLYLGYALLVSDNNLFCLFDAVDHDWCFRILCFSPAHGVARLITYMQPLVSRGTSLPLRTHEPALATSFCLGSLR